MTNREIEVSLGAKRAVRQRCAFGCVICGLPVFQYDHIYGYTLENADDPAAITLLCPRHHDEKTKELLPLAKVVAANEAPFNVKNGVSAPYEMHYDGQESAIHIGSCSFTGIGTYVCALLWRDEEVIAFDFNEGQLSLNVNLRDRAGNLTLSIIDNELIYSVHPWDIEFVGRMLTVRQGLGDIMFKLFFQTPFAIRLARATLAYEDVTININAKKIKVVGPMIPALGSPRIREFERISMHGIRYGIVLDCSRPILGVAGIMT